MFSAINQQIALKTIRKLGFTVSAVWNGKEALEYLLAAGASDAPHPKPDIILMDVQMPIIDGYRATHVIRHHSPFRLATRNIPIVAMTASAIQGDREKCQRAGMDDYLAKPVKGKILEKMIVKWAISRRSADTPGGSDYESSECSDTEEHDCGAVNIPRIGGMEADSKMDTSPLPQAAAEPSMPRPTMSERQNSRQLVLPGTESEADREELRLIAQEKALFLRDDKMVEAAGGQSDGLLSQLDREDTVPPGQRLTIENVGRLQQEHDGELSGWGGMQKQTVTESGKTEPGGVAKGSKGERPKRQRRWHDSQRTVTDNDR